MSHSAPAARLNVTPFDAIYSHFPKVSDAQPFTAATAPDASSKLALAHPLLKVYQGAPLNASMSPYIHKNFPQIIEQNFARLDAAGAKQLVDNLSEKELASQEKPLMDLVIDVLEGEREKAMAVDDEKYAFALLSTLKKHHAGMTKFPQGLPPNLLSLREARRHVLRFHQLRAHRRRLAFVLTGPRLLPQQDNLSRHATSRRIRFDRRDPPQGGD